MISDLISAAFWVSVPCMRVVLIEFSVCNLLLLYIYIYIYKLYYWTMRSSGLEISLFHHSNSLILCHWWSTARLSLVMKKLICLLPLLFLATCSLKRNLTQILPLCKDVIWRSSVCPSSWFLTNKDQHGQNSFFLHVIKTKSFNTIKSPTNHSLIHSFIHFFTLTPMKIFNWGPCTIFLYM